MEQFNNTNTQTLDAIYNFGSSKVLNVQCEMYLQYHNYLANIITKCDWYKPTNDRPTSKLII